MTEKEIYFPTLGIEEFSTDQSRGKSRILFHELHGERHIHSPHQHDFFILILFERGKGVHHIDFTEYPIGDRQVHLLFPGQVHQWSIAAGTRGYQLMIARGFFEGFSSALRFSAAAYQKNPVIDLDSDTFGLIRRELEAIRRELEDSLEELLAARATVLALILSKMASRVFLDLEGHAQEPRIEAFQQLIEVYFKEEKLVSFYASKLSISPNYLNILCRKHLNMSATQVIHYRILLESKRLLKSTSRSVKEIAFELGFVDHSYFSNFFKKQTGVTPRGFRE